MYKLFYETLTNIQYRNHKRELYDTDPFIERALNNSLTAHSTKGIAIKFVTSLRPLFEYFEKEPLIKYFGNDFIDNEIALEAEIKHKSHILHVIQVFLIGYNIITSWSYLTDKFKNRSLESIFFFSRFCLSWLMASLFHDFGYIIEKTHERFRKINNQYNEILRGFKGFKALPVEPIGLGENRSIAEKIHNVFNTELKKSLTFDNFIDLFKVRSSGTEEGLEHGLFSAIAFIKMLEIAEKKHIFNLEQELKKSLIYQDEFDYRVQEKFIDNKINIYAYLAMLLHNFHKIQFDKDDNRKYLSLSCCREAEIIPYLLMICDLVQEWDRQKFDYDIINNESDKVYAKEKLDFCRFGENLAIFQINHILQEKSKILAYAEQLGKSLLSNQEKITMEIKYLLPNGAITIPDDLEEKIRLQKKIEDQSHFILEPIEKDRYEIVINHVIEGIPYYTVNYYL